MVYHYTTIDTFYNMLASYKEAENYNLEFWASSILNQNDKEELSLNVGEIMPVLQRYEQSKEGESLTNLQKLTTVEEQWWVPMLTGHSVRGHLNKFFEDKENVPFTISFSKQQDTLLMWTMYANNGNGICLAFDEEEIVKGNAYRYSIADRVFYNKDPRHYEVLINKLYNMYKEEIKDETIINTIYQIKLRYWACMLMGISPFIKNAKFKDEEEFRVVYYKKSYDNPKVYSRLTSRQNIVDYIKVKIPIQALKYIIIGPCANYRRVKKLLVENMKSCNIERDYDKRFIRKSKVPYRIY